MKLIDRNPSVSVQETEYKRLLGYPRQHGLEGRALELADRTRQWFAEHGRPWIYARETVLKVSAGKLQIGRAEFSSDQLCQQMALAGAHGAMLVAVSAGPECEEQARELWLAGKPDEYFFLEMYGSAVVENLIATTGGRICDWAEQNGMTVLPHYSPGYPGWDVADQNRLWDVICPGSGEEFPGGLEVMDTGMLRPKKSVLAVFGLTRHVDRVRRLADLIPCENCSLPGCRYRRAPHRHAPPQIEEVTRRGGMNSRAADDSAARVSPLTLDAKYATSVRALGKWARERLQLEFGADGSVTARFRYDGTTCVNLGQPLSYDYRVRLGPPADGYRIVEAACAPAPGDTGHAQQCGFLADAGALRRGLEGETPLLGRPLNDVLAWERSFSPSGCYCDADRRLHKWGLVYEAIHFALVQVEKQRQNLEPA